MNVFGVKKLRLNGNKNLELIRVYPRVPLNPRYRHTNLLQAHSNGLENHLCRVTIKHRWNYCKVSKRRLHAPISDNGLIIGSYSFRHIFGTVIHNFAFWLESCFPRRQCKESCTIPKQSPRAAIWSICKSSIRKHISHIFAERLSIKSLLPDRNPNRNFFTN